MVSYPPPLYGLYGRTSLGISGYAVTDVAATAGVPAVDDAMRAYFAVTWVANVANLGIQSNIGPLGTALVTVANTGPGGVALLTIASASTFTTGYGVMFEWAGKPIAIAGAGTAGAVLVAVVSSVYLDRTSQIMTAVLDRAAPTPLAGASQKVACPCFTDGTVTGVPWNCVGKNIYLTVGGQLSGTGVGAATSINQVSTPLATTIASYTDPFTVVLTAAPKTTSVTAVWNGCQITWGTNNRAAFIAAANYAIARKQRVLSFPGWTSANSTGVFAAFNWQHSVTTSFDQTDQDAGLAQGYLAWESQNAEVVLLTDSASNVGSFDTHCRITAIPANANSPSPPRQELIGRIHLPNCAGKTSLVVLVTGDSWPAEDPTGGPNNSASLPIIAAIRRHNPGATIYVENRARGGSTWRMMSDPLAIGGGSNLYWVTDITKPWYYYMQNVVTPIGTVVPDIILALEQGNNEVSGLHAHEIDAFLNMAATWQTRNGKPPDVIMASSGNKAAVTVNAGTLDTFSSQIEYSTTLTRNRARVLKKGLLDWQDRGNITTNGWTYDNLALRLVPPVPSAVASATVPYCLSYLCRDYFAMLKLTGTSGSDFWTRAGLLRIRLSAKPDNMAVIGLDSSNNLNVAVWERGRVIATPVSITAGSTTLVTSGQTAITMQGNNTLPATPTFLVSSNTNPFLSTMVGQCFLGVGIGQKRSNVFTDWSSHIMGYTGTSVVMFADPNQPLGISNTSAFVGGWMFTVWDALGQSDIVIPGAGTTNHPHFGANCLVTKIVGYTDMNTVTLADAATSTLTASTQNVFCGKFSSVPSYEYANGAGLDAVANPVLTVRKSGSRLRIGYILGTNVAAGSADFRGLLQGAETILWEGEVGGAGAPFVPQIWSDSVAGVTLTSEMQAVGERILYKPMMTAREAWGVPNTLLDQGYSGDTSHPSLLFIEHVTKAVADAQNWIVPSAISLPTTISELGDTL